jgi:hypothetical protein
MKIDYKISTWERFEIEDEHKDDLFSFLKDNPNANGIDIHNWYLGLGGNPYVETMSGTEDCMTPKNNGGFATLAIYEDPNEDAIFLNGN